MHPHQKKKKNVCKWKKEKEKRKKKKKKIPLLHVYKNSFTIYYCGFQKILFSSIWFSFFPFLLKINIKKKKIK